MDEKELAKKYASILAFNFPDSYWYEKTYKILNELEIKKIDDKWYEKFNPIKLLIRDKEENNYNKSIQSIK